MAEQAGLMGSLAAAGRTRLIAALAVAAIVAGGLGAIMMRAGSGEMAVLYTALDLTEAGEIAGRLDQASIKYEFRGDGSSIFIPRDKVMDARMLLAADGLPTRGSVGYEIFDKADGLGTTAFTQNVQRLRALEGELARSIASLSSVRQAKVHLVLPERRLFEREQTPPSASIVVDIPGAQASPGEVNAIRNLVAGAVPGLTPEGVTIVDQRGRMLAAANMEAGAGGMGGPVEDRKAGVEERMRGTVMSIVEGVVGPGAALVQLSADIDFNRVTQQSETFDPDGRVVRSTTTSEETNDESSREDRRGVTVDNNVPGGDAAADAGPQNQIAGRRTDETVNYEISRTTRTEIIEGGRINRLSVSVAVDDRMVTAEDGTVSYVPRTEEELSRITALVRTAVGFDEARGDQVEVVNISFNRPENPFADEAPAGLLNFDKNDIMRGVELLALLVAAIALILFVLRPLVSGLLNPQSVRLAVSSGPGGVTAIGPDGKPAPRAIAASNGNLALPEGNGEESPEDSRMDVARISGQVKASSIRKIAEVIDSHPDESVSIFRTWLNDREGSRA